MKNSAFLILFVGCFALMTMGCSGRTSQNVAENASQEEIDAYKQRIAAEEAAMNASFEKGDSNPQQ
ncbi:membrane or secreted protein [Rhodopirellula maiorica SM1]|uniref:Membrane or secreted protein n=1 Tax=Rhodopirellula maiorica SM1 TaxID=1265738 RepID=M5RGH0_9BACT|nr:hypothetical protein [Rhodopirellula maiorica]EMI18420.1 membrane or secreted protein [Rhodopirellula maiorica SM1]